MNNKNNNNNNKQSDYAFVLVHFGSGVRYFELELYLMLNLKKYTKNDIIYLYCVKDTPKIYKKIMSKIGIIAVGYDDDGITVGRKKSYISKYSESAFRTCNYIFAYKLINYKKICCLESDMIITKNLDEIFELKCPAMLYYSNNKNNNYVNYKIKLNVDEMLTNCEISKFNGGIMLFEPSLKIYEESLKNLEVIIKNKCTFPNEILFAYTNRNNLYNMPIMYNRSRYLIGELDEYACIGVCSIYHFTARYKQLEIIEEDYIRFIDNSLLRRALEDYKKNIYDKYKKIVNRILEKVRIIIKKEEKN